MIQSGYLTINCPGDADSTIVKTAPWNGKYRLGTCYHCGWWQGVAMMLVHHWQSNMSDVYFFQERWNKARSIKDTSSKRENIKQHLLFVHAWSGCDTVSSVFGKGKTKLAENITGENRQPLSEVISSPWSNQPEVRDASLKISLCYMEERREPHLQNWGKCRLFFKGSTGTRFDGKTAICRKKIWSIISNSKQQTGDGNWMTKLSPLFWPAEIAPESLTK